MKTYGARQMLSGFVEFAAFLIMGLVASCAGAPWWLTGAYALVMGWTVQGIMRP